MKINLHTILRIIPYWATPSTSNTNFLLFLFFNTRGLISFLRHNRAPGMALNFSNLEVPPRRRASTKPPRDKLFEFLFPCIAMLWCVNHCRARGHGGDAWNLRFVDTTSMLSKSALRFLSRIHFSTITFSRRAGFARVSNPKPRAHHLVTFPTEKDGPSGVHLSRLGSPRMLSMSTLCYGVASIFRLLFSS
ncbi:hypothetical protein F5Y16DRAFT_75538 [Xylariaceae sp. FL0255]|nr:hypothetical protein F5Y16DRAFT_75538 [Xylariaceae sp. FL0255]